MVGFFDIVFPFDRLVVALSGHQQPRSHFYVSISLSLFSPNYSLYHFQLSPLLIPPSVFVARPRCLFFFPISFFRDWQSTLLWAVFWDRFCFCLSRVILHAHLCVLLLSIIVESTWLQKRSITSKLWYIMYQCENKKKETFQERVYFFEDSFK